MLHQEEILICLQQVCIREVKLQQRNIYVHPLFVTAIYCGTDIQQAQKERAFSFFAKPESADSERTTTECLLFTKRFICGAIYRLFTDRLKDRFCWMTIDMTGRRTGRS